MTCHCITHSKVNKSFTTFTTFTPNLELYLDQHVFSNPHLISLPTSSARRSYPFTYNSQIWWRFNVSTGTDQSRANVNTLLIQSTNGFNRSTRLDTWIENELTIFVRVVTQIIFARELNHRRTTWASFGSTYGFKISFTIAVINFFKKLQRLTMIFSSGFGWYNVSSDWRFKNNSSVI